MSLILLENHAETSESEAFQEPQTRNHIDVRSTDNPISQNSMLDVSYGGGESYVDQFEDQFLADNPEALGINFEEEAKFFDPEAAHEADFLHPAPVEESIYTDDPVRVYLREMGAVPLLTREGEVDLARRMERGKLRMQKAISRSALVQRVVVELGRAVEKGRRWNWTASPIWATSKKALRPI